MCCLLTVLMFLGPRTALGVWWLVDMNWFSRVYDTFIWPFAGFVFLPFTTLMWSLVLKFDPVIGVSGWNWIWIGLAFVTDIASYGGGGYGNRNRIPGYSTSPA
ncbi:MAG: hypothetical protein ACJ78Q_08765 [Chloroflexia bacterium]